MPPPPLHTSVIGSFAHDTLRVRVPEILRKTRAQLGALPPDVARRLDELDAELRRGTVRGLAENTADRPAWDEAVRPHLGHSWLDLPWYFAETFFYRRLLEATGYFGSGPWRDRDPFGADKAGEWAPAEAPARCAEALAAAPSEPGPRLRALMLASLWGNRADLSYNVARQLGSHTGDAAADLLADHSPAVAELLLAHRCPRVTLIADNAGTELLMDLALIDHLLTACGVQELVMDVKDHPFFVSDTLVHDVDDGLGALVAAGGACAALAARVREHRSAGRLIIGSHPFYTSSLFYPALPADLRDQLGRSNLVILKGDANYRRLCSDARWPPETPFADVVAGFPAPLAALRTCKAEVIVGLPPGVAEGLSATDPTWMVNGRRGVIQARL
jgi:Damage-control phosphatase ARMT1-like domain